MTTHPANHLTDEEAERCADGELREERLVTATEHVEECARCATAVLSVMQMKRAVREAMPRFTPPRRIVMPYAAAGKPLRWLGVAAMIALLTGAWGVLVARRADAGRELIDLHATIVGSTQPVDVISTDRHTVKPWFEGRVPFAVDVPELGATPFRLAGGRVVFWRGEPGAYLLLTKGAHRISLFVFDENAVPRAMSPPASMTMLIWRANGRAYIAVGDVAIDEMTSLRALFR